jgi:hypothetical protein
MFVLNNAYANSGDEKKSNKTNPDTKMEVKGAPKIELRAPEPVVELDRSVLDKAITPYHRQAIFDQEGDLSGEDQNAVISFNVIQYFFKTFKFSEEVY